MYVLVEVITRTKIQLGAHEHEYSNMLLRYYPRPLELMKKVSLTLILECSFYI